VTPAHRLGGGESEDGGGGGDNGGGAGCCAGDARRQWGYHHRIGRWISVDGGDDAPRSRLEFEGERFLATGHRRGSGGGVRQGCHCSLGRGRRAMAWKDDAGGGAGGR
jgi:hypothetical protein